MIDLTKHIKDVKESGMLASSTFDGFKHIKPRWPGGTVMTEFLLQKKGPISSNYPPKFYRMALVDYMLARTLLNQDFRFQILTCFIFSAKNTI